MALQQPKGEIFCQRAPVFLDYLHSVLQKYPDGGQILKELVQNADDAGAHEVVFVSDEREFDVSSGGLQGTQGPALLAYNDAPMAPRDWKGILSPGVSHKRQDPSTVGRFGLGFTSVYHLTDLPGVLSAPSLGVLDPECQVLPGAGGRWDISAAKDLPGLFEPFWAGLEAVGRHRGSAQGTLFRFPLRRQPSGISAGVSGPERLRSLFETFLSEAPLALLFLRHIRRVALHRVAPDGVQTLLGTLEATSQPLPEPGPPGAAGLALTWSLVALQGDGVGDDRSKWLVATGRATEGPAVALGTALGCCPELSLAHPLCGPCQGRLCCFLPLPATDETATGLPVHASAPFALSDDRRHLRWPEEGSEEESEEGSEDARWNALLLLGLLPQIYGHMATVASALPDTDPYSIWPDPECVPGGSRIRSLLARVCQELADVPALVPAAGDPSERLRAAEAVLLPDGVGDVATRRVVRGLLVAAGEAVAEVPARVQRVLATAGAGREATPGLIREVLRRRGAPGVPAADRLSLLRYVAADGSHAELRGLPLLPRSNGTFVAFGAASDTVYVDTADCPRDLLPGLAASFLPLDLEPGTASLLQDIATAGLFPNLVLLDSAVTVQTLRSALPPSWMSPPAVPVTWCPARGLPEPPSSWLPALWRFLATHVEDLAPLEGLPLIPLSPLGAPSIPLAPLRPKSALIFQEWEDRCLPPAVAPVLEALGCPVVPPGTWHRALSRYVLPPSPLNALRALGRRGAAVVAPVLASLPAADAGALRQYLADVPSLTRQDAETLAALPLFVQLPCLAAPRPTQPVPAGAASAVEPVLEPPEDVMLPEAMLRCRDEADRRLLGRLNRPLLGAARVALEAVRAVARGTFEGRPAEMQALLLWVLRHSDIFFAQSPELLGECSQLAFLETPKGLVCPRDLYDPHDSTLRALLGPERFPPAAFHSPPVLRALRVLGLRQRGGYVQPSDILGAAKSVSQGGLAALDRAQALLEVCNRPGALAGFRMGELKKLCYLPWVPGSACTEEPAQPFLAVEDLCSSRYQPLVGLSMHLTAAFTPEAERRLGLNQPPPPHKVWEQLQLLAGRGDLLADAGSALRPVYQHMQENLRSFGIAPNAAVVWTGTGFALPRDAVLCYPEELELGMLVPRVPPEFLSYSSLFKAWGVQAAVSEERAVAALRSLGQDIDTRPSGAGTAAELQAVVAVLEWLQRRGHRGEGTVPVPVRIPAGSGFALRPATSAVCRDMELEAEDDVQEVLHEAVPPGTAVFLGAELLSTRVLGPEPFAACGPSEPITLRLRNILREYGEESDLFTELVQNAEDAGATICRFLLDLRHRGRATSGLLDPGMAACHGPALWAYNDAQFTEDDLRNITRVGAATKEGQAGRIGRFGLGFSSVYRVTDVPAVLSGETLLIFDPNGTHLGKHIPSAGCPGIRLDFSRRPRILRAFAEQFWPYHGVFGCRLPEPGPFPGSLFRLPFRTEEEALTSQICSEAFGAERVRSLGAGFLGSSRLLLLFLRSVRKITLETLPEAATSAESTAPLATLQRKDIRDLGAPGDPPGTWAAVTKLTACEEASKTAWHYLVLVCRGDEELLELFRRNEQAGLRPAPPAAGVALPLAPAVDGKWMPSQGAEEGRVFCHLPMPVASGLPIHVHGAFSTLTNRKGLWDSAERGQWNRVLLRKAVVGAWLRALDHLRAMHEAGELRGYEYHVFWPDAATARYPFTEAAQGFYQAVAAGDGPRLFSDGRSWCSLPNARFLHPAVATHPELGAAAKRALAATLPPPLLAVDLPERVLNGLGEAAATGTYDWPRFYCELVLPNLEGLPAGDRDALLLHALDTASADVSRALQRVPCVPTAPHGRLQLIQSLVHPRGRAAALFDPEDERFPAGDAFLAPERLGQLERLGMIKDTMTVPDLLGRAETVQTLWAKDCARGCRRAACILELLRDAMEDRVANTVQVAFQNVPFLPATLPSGECALLPAAQLYHDSHAPLVGLVHPVLAPKMLGEDFSLPKEVTSFLGLDRQLPASTVLAQLRALSRSSNSLPLENLQNSTDCCYRHLHLLLQRDQSSWAEVASAVPQGEPFVLVGSCFVPLAAVAETLLFKAAPYLHQLPEQYWPYGQLWKCVGLRRAFAWDDYAGVLRALAEKHAGEPLPDAELSLALQLLCGGLTVGGEEPDAYQSQQLFLPDQAGVLRPRDKLCYNDTPWLPADGEVPLCHERVSRATALRCGVPTTRHRALERNRLSAAELSLWVQPFGAFEDLCTRLKNILSEYPACAHDLVKEFLQNADDAGARTLHFVWDRRQHPASATFSESWNALQGPALCIYNDSPFRQRDIEGIQQLGLGAKRGRQDVTGKYGLGFNTAFHFTDCPAFLTGDSALCVFDPHLCYVPGAKAERPGGMFAVSPEFKRTFGDVYGTFLPSLFDLNQGVLFRLPLRSAAGATRSKVSDMVVRDEDLRAIENVLAQEGQDLLLFLRHLRTVVFSEIPPDGEQLLERLRVAAVLSAGEEKLRQGFQERLSQAADESDPVSTSYTMTVKNSQTRTSTVWRVISQLGVQEGAAESPVPGRLPYGAVAASLELPSLNSFKGKAFCTLPLPLATGLPVHINANFSLDASRRSLRQDPGSAEAAWNGFLLRRLMAPLYRAFLASQWKALGPKELQFKDLDECKRRLTYRYLKFFPTVAEAHPAFKGLVKDLYRDISLTRLPLVPVHHVKPPDRTVVVTWASPGGEDVLTEPYFLKEVPREDLQAVLQRLRMSLVPAFGCLQQVYAELTEAGVGAAALQPASLRCFLRALALPVPCELAKTPLGTAENCSALLSYCLKDRVDQADLEGLPLLATQDGHLNALSAHRPVFKSAFSELFPHHRHLFAERLSLNCSLPPCFVQELGLPEAAPLVRETLAQLSCTTEQQTWLQKLWRFFSCVISTAKTPEDQLNTLVTLLGDATVLPVEGGEKGSKHLLPLSSLPDVLMERGATGVGGVLFRLGIPALQLSLLPSSAVLHLENRALQVTDPKAVLARLAGARAGLRWQDLEELDVAVLLRFVQGKMDRAAQEQLQLLPLFRKYSGERVAVAPYRKVLLLRRLCQELPAGTEALYGLDGDMLLLAADRIDERLATELHWEFTDERHLFRTVVLPRLAQIPARSRVEAARLFFSVQHICDQKLEAAALAAFRTVPFIPDALGQPRQASYFYTDTPSFRTLRLQHRFVPESFFSKLSHNLPSLTRRRSNIEDFLLQVGVRESLSEEDFVTLALEIEREAAQAPRGAEDLLARQKEMHGQLGRLLEQPLSAGFLEQIASVRFLPAADVPSDLQDLHPPFAGCPEPVALKGSVYWQSQAVELLWTSASILPEFCAPGQDSVEALAAAGALVEIPTALVLANLEKVSRAACRGRQQASTRARVLLQMYGFLEGCLKEVDAGRLAELPVVLAKSGDMAVPRQVVSTLPHEEGFYPYLFMPDPRVAVYSELLQHLGVVPPTLAHYSRVLAQIHQESRAAGTLSTTQKQSALLATKHFFQLLQSLESPDFSAVEELYLLSTADSLEPAHRLHFNDCVSLGTSRALAKTFLFMADLPESRRNAWWLLRKLPRRLQPRALSQVTEQQLEEGTLQLCRYGPRCPGQRRLQSLLASPWFGMGLEALLRWQSHRAEVQAEGDSGFALEQLEVQCCKVIRTVLLHQGARVEGSSKPRVVHVSLTGGAQRLLYIQHADTVLGRRQIRVLETLAQEINVILGQQLEAPALAVLREMLVCQEPREVAAVLEENNVALPGAALELQPELEKSLWEEAVATEAMEAKPRKGWHSLMPKVKGSAGPRHHCYRLCGGEAVELTPSIPEAQRWLRQARSDLQAAHNDAGHSCPNWVLFKVHQALEKALVAAVLCCGEASEAPEGLAELAQWLETAEPKLRGLAEEVGWLCGCGVDGKATQYPSYHPFPITPDQAFDRVDEEEVLKRGRGVLGRLQEHVEGM